MCRGFRYDVGVITNLKCEVEGEYNVTVSFKELTNGGLKNYTDLRVLLGDEVIHESKLSEVLDFRNPVEIKFTCELDMKSTVPLTFEYSMPEGVGNDAKRTTAKFNTNILIEGVLNDVLD